MRLRRFAAADVYLSDFRAAYHALRPLRFVLDCTAEPVVAYLQELIRNVACRIIFPVANALRGVPSGRHPSASETATPWNATEGDPYRHEPCPGIAQGNFGEQVLATQAHFGMQIGDDGENCHVVDERGQSVETERLLALVRREFRRPRHAERRLRQQTFRRMRESRATIAADTPAGSGMPPVMSRCPTHCRP